MSINRLPFFAILLAWSTLLHASLEEVVIPCAGCSHDEAAVMASGAVAANQNVFLYVADFESEKLWRFHARSEVADGNSHARSSPAEVDPQVQALFDDWLRIKDVPDSTVIDAPESVGVSTAYDLVGRSRDQGLIADFIFENKSELLNFPEEVISDSPSWIYWLASTHYSKNKKVEITVVFPDGSEAQYRMAFPKMLNFSTVDIEHVAESCRDSDGNSIPEDLRAFEYSSGQLIISDPQGANFSRWKARVARLGFELEGNYEDFATSACTYRCFRVKCKLECQASSLSQ